MAAKGKRAPSMGVWSRAAAGLVVAVERRGEDSLLGAGALAARFMDIYF